MPPTLAAISERVETAADVKKAVGGALVHTDDAGTVSTVLWGSQADVDDRAGSDGDGKVDAAGGAVATVSGMQVVEEAIEETYLRETTGCGALLMDGWGWLHLKRAKAKWARQRRAGQVPQWEECYWAKIGCEGWEGSSEGSLEEFAARSDGGFEATGPAEAEGDDDAWGAATVTAAAPADTAGAANLISRCCGRCCHCWGLGGGQQRLWGGCGAREWADLDQCGRLRSRPAMYRR